MIFKRVIFLLAFNLYLFGVANAQVNPIPGQQEEEQAPKPVEPKIRDGKILDDSTKQIYGPTTTKFTLEKYIRYNLPRQHEPQFYTIDTLVENFHHFNFLNSAENMYQNLGNIGTAAFPIFFQVPDIIGNHGGFHSYDLYFTGPEDIRYYDSKSPFSQLDVVLGGSGRATTEVKYSRNIKPHWNIGFDYRGLFIDKQISRVGRGDRNVESIAYDIYTRYKYKEQYELLANFSRNSHDVNESGGVFLSLNEGQAITDELFFEENISPRLVDANSKELRTNYHLFHQYTPTNLVQVYHSLDRYRQVNTFKVNGLTSTAVVADVNFLPDALIDEDTTRDRTIYRVLENEIGVKGDIGPSFYNFYYKARQVQVQHKHLEDDAFGLDEFESYGGFNIRLQKDSSLYIAGFGEVLASGGGIGEGAYKVGGEIHSKWFEGRLQRVVSLPNHITQSFSGNHYAWENNFDAISSNELYGKANLDLGSFIFQPFASAKSVSNFVYFDQQVNPAQESGSFEVLSTGFDARFTFFKRVTLKGKLLFTNVSGDGADKYRVPDIFSNAQLFYENILFDGNLQLQVGLDGHWKSTYKANAYDPVIQQFYLQDDIDVNSFPIVDFFANLKINRGRLFIKYHNLFQLSQGFGYLPTPFYPGLSNTLDFGFMWAFYD